MSSSRSGLQRSFWLVVALAVSALVTIACSSSREDSAPSETEAPGVEVSYVMDPDSPLAWVAVARDKSVLATLALKDAGGNAVAPSGYFYWDGADDFLLVETAAGGSLRRIQSPEATGWFSVRDDGLVDVVVERDGQLRSAEITREALAAAASEPEGKLSQALNQGDERERAATELRAARTVVDALKCFWKAYNRDLKETVRECLPDVGEVLDENLWALGADVVGAVGACLASPRVPIPLPPPVVAAWVLYECGDVIVEVGDFLAEVNRRRLPADHWLPPMEPPDEETPGSVAPRECAEGSFTPNPIVAGESVTIEVHYRDDTLAAEAQLEVDLTDFGVAGFQPMERTGGEWSLSRTLAVPHRDGFDVLFRVGGRDLCGPHEVKRTLASQPAVAYTVTASASSSAVPRGDAVTLSAEVQGDTPISAEFVWVEERAGTSTVVGEGETIDVTPQASATYRVFVAIDAGGPFIYRATDEVAISVLSGGGVTYTGGSLCDFFVACVCEGGNARSGESPEECTNVIRDQQAMHGADASEAACRQLLSALPQGVCDFPGKPEVTCMLPDCFAMTDNVAECALCCGAVTPIGDCAQFSLECNTACGVVRNQCAEKCSSKGTGGTGGIGGAGGRSGAGGTGGRSGAGGTGGSAPSPCQLVSAFQSGPVRDAVLPVLQSSNECTADECVQASLNVTCPNGLTVGASYSVRADAHDTFIATATGAIEELCSEAPPPATCGGVSGGSTTVTPACVEGRCSWKVK